MSKSQYHYDAFISYRHNDLDKFVAVSIHRLLENYKLPKSVIKQFNLTKTKINRVFRDQEELPLANNLEDPILEALSNSEYLIVICSPRLKDSLWCQKEIETFIKLHGREKVLAVLVEGEPNESFPKGLVEEETTVNGKKVIKYYEPLALDVRGNSKKEIYKNIKKELLRLLAPMFNLNYDDLKRRHHERKIKRIITSSISIGIFLLLLVIYMSINIIIINNKQNTILNLYSENLAENANKYLNDDNRGNAIKTAYQALTKYDGFTMPYTANSEYALSNALNLYDIGDAYRVTSQLDTKGVVNYVHINADGNMLLSHDKSNELVLWDLKTSKRIETIKDNYNGDKSVYSSFIGNERFAYVTKDGNIKILNYSGEELKEISSKFVLGIYGSEDSDMFAVSTINKITIYNAEYEEIYTYDLNQTNYLSGDICFDNNFAIIGIAEYNKSSLELLKINLDTKEINKVQLVGANFKLIRIKSDKVFVLTTDSEGFDKYSTDIYALNYQDLSEIWHKNYENRIGSLMQRSYAENTDTLMVICYDVAYLLDGATGNEINTYGIGEGIKSLLVSSINNTYNLYTASGVNYFITNNNETAISIPYQYEFKYDSYDNYYISEYGIVAIPRSDNRILLYDLKKDDAVKEIEYDYQKPKYYFDFEIKEIIKDYKLVKEDLVTGLVFNDEKDKAFITYSDNTLDIFDVKNKTILNTVNGISESIKFYLGTDNENNIYISGDVYGYVLDNNYNVIRCIKNLVAVDKKNNKVILHYSSSSYEAPIYSLKELLDIAKERIENENGSKI